MSKPVATNKKAYRNFTLSKTWECGIALTGGEVKSIRAASVDFKDTYARIDKGQVYLYNLHVTPYKQAGYMTEEPDRKRKLLLHKQEILKIANLLKEQAGVLVPTKLYFNKRGLLKVELALGKGKKMFDKRETIKTRSIEMGLKRAIKARRG